MTDADRLQMAALALIKHNIYTVEIYAPLVWNDEGVYTYFYIDFQKALKLFSLGMFAESIMVYGNDEIPVSQVEMISAGIYKVYCDISGNPHGISITNSKISLIKLTSGGTLPAFIVHFFVAGQESYENAAYLYETSIMQVIEFGVQNEAIQFDYQGSMSAGSFKETAAYENPTFTFSENNILVELTTA